MLTKILSNKFYLRADGSFLLFQSIWKKNLPKISNQERVHISLFNMDIDSVCLKFDSSSIYWK